MQITDWKNESDNLLVLRALKDYFGTPFSLPASISQCFSSLSLLNLVYCRYLHQFLNRKKKDLCAQITLNSAYFGEAEKSVSSMLRILLCSRREV